MQRQIEILDSSFKDTGYGVEYFYTLTDGYMRLEVIPEMVLVHGDLLNPTPSTMRQFKDLGQEHVIPFIKEVLTFDECFALAPNKAAYRFAKILSNNTLEKAGDTEVGPLYYISLKDI